MKRLTAGAKPPTAQLQEREDFIQCHEDGAQLYLSKWKIISWCPGFSWGLYYDIWHHEQLVF